MTQSLTHIIIGTNEKNFSLVSVESGTHIWTLGSKEGVDFICMVVSIILWVIVGLHNKQLFPTNLFFIFILKTV